MLLQGCFLLGHDGQILSFGATVHEKVVKTHFRVLGAVHFDIPGNLEEVGLDFLFGGFEAFHTVLQLYLGVADLVHLRLPFHPFEQGHPGGGRRIQSGSLARHLCGFDGSLNRKITDFMTIHGCLFTLIDYVRYRTR